MNECFLKSNLDFPGIQSFFAWIRIRIGIKVRPGSGSITTFFQILDPYQMKRIRILEYGERETESSRKTVQNYLS